MTDNDDSSDAVTQHGEKSGIIVWLDEAVLICLLVLSIAGTTVSDFSPQDAYLYWLAMIPIFSIGAILAGWAQSRREGRVRGHEFKELLKIQSLHWIGVLCTVIGVFLLHYMQFLNETAAALVMLLILALATFLDGIRIGWRFSLVGIFLGVTAMIIAFMEQFIPLVVLTAIGLIVYSIYRGRHTIRHHN